MEAHAFSPRSLPDHIGRSLICGLGVLTTLIVIASVTPWFLLGFAFLSVIYFYNARLFAKSARELRRLDSVSKSPLYSICTFRLAAAEHRSGCSE